MARRTDADGTKLGELGTIGEAVIATTGTTEYDIDDPPRAPSWVLAPRRPHHRRLQRPRWLWRGRLRTSRAPVPRRCAVGLHLPRLLSRSFGLLAGVILLGACHPATRPSSVATTSSGQSGPHAAPSTNTGPPSAAGEPPGLQPDLRAAWAQAERAARNEGVRLRITSGYRSAEQQRYLWNEAIKQYGTAQRASAWVLPPNKSQHVQGIAIDVDRETARWLSMHGARYHLCQAYRNEWWHYAYQSNVGAKCPPPEASPLISSRP